MSQQKLNLGLKSDPAFNLDFLQIMIKSDMIFNLSSKPRFVPTFSLRKITISRKLDIFHVCWLQITFKYFKPHWVQNGIGNWYWVYKSSESSRYQLIAELHLGIPTDSRQGCILMSQTLKVTYNSNWLI